MSKMDWISIVMECMKTFSLSQPDLNQFAGMTHLSHSESGSVGHPLAPQNGRFSWQTALKSYAHLDDKVHSSWLDLNQISIENGWSQTLFLKSLRNSNFQVVSLEPIFGNQRFWIILYDSYNMCQAEIFSLRLVTAPTKLQKCFIVFGRWLVS